MIFFRRSSGCDYADPTNIIFHRSTLPVIQNLKIEQTIQPRLLCILNSPESFQVDVGQVVTYESSNFGNILMSDDLIAIVEAVETPSGQRLVVSNSIPNVDQVLVYQIGNQIAFQIEPIINEIPNSTCWWMGKGIYALHSDHCWRPEFCLSETPTRDVAYLESIDAAHGIANRVENAQKALKNALETIGLPLRSEYINITQEQCKTLSEIGNLWKLSWCWSDHKIKRHFRHPLTIYSFYWSYKEEI